MTGSRTKKLRIPMLLMSLLLLLLLGGLGVIVAQRPQVRTVDAYPLDESPLAAAAFTGNQVVVLGKVVEIGSVREVRRAGRGDISLVYSPVEVEVERVVRALTSLPKTITVRAYGGQVGNTMTEVNDLASRDDLAVGSRVLLFLASAVDVGDGVLAYAPNIVYRVNALGQARSQGDRHSIDLDAFITMIEDARI